MLFHSKKIVFVLDFLSFIQDREVVGIYSSFRRAIEIFEEITLTKRWREGDVYSIYEVETNKTFEGGLQSPVFHTSLYGPSFSDEKFEKLYYKYIRECIPRETFFWYFLQNEWP